MRTRVQPLITAVAVLSVLAAGACSTPADAGLGTPTSPGTGAEPSEPTGSPEAGFGAGPGSGSGSGAGSDSGSGSGSGSSGGEPAAPPIEYRVSYGWAVPSTEVRVDHPLTAPLPGPIGRPYLVGIYTGNHPSADPPYQRISFYFRGGFPSYRFQYAPAVHSEGDGSPIPLPGNGYMRITFLDAQAHDEHGASTIVDAAPTTIGYPNLRGYGFAGDFEGHVTYGLGIQVAPDSDQVLSIRAGELKKSDGSGDFFYVVHFDVQSG